MITNTLIEIPFSFPYGHGKVLCNPHGREELGAVDLNTIDLVEPSEWQELSQLAKYVLERVRDGKTVIITDATASSRMVSAVAEIAHQHLQCSLPDAAEWVGYWLKAAPVKVVNPVYQRETTPMPSPAATAPAATLVGRAARLDAEFQADLDAAIQASLKDLEALNVPNRKQPNWVQDLDEWGDLSSDNETVPPEVVNPEELAAQAVQLSDRAWAAFEKSGSEEDRAEVAEALATEFEIIEELCTRKRASIESIDGDPITLNDRTFIACMAPERRDEVEDFWQYIWDNNVPLIIKLVESRAPKKKWNETAQKMVTHAGNIYWPNSAAARAMPKIGLTVSFQELISVAGGITVRSFTIVGPKNEQRTVVQLDCPHMPDMGVVRIAEYEHLIAQCNAQIAQVATDRQILVHCGGGRGRTGLLLMGLATLTMKDRSEIPEALYNMRLQRHSMVETAEQYSLVHRHFFSIHHPDEGVPYFSLKSTGGLTRRLAHYPFQGLPYQVGKFVRRTLAEVTPKANMLWNILGAFNGNQDKGSQVNESQVNGSQDTGSHDKGSHDKGKQEAQPSAVVRVQLVSQATLEVDLTKPNGVAIVQGELSKPEQELADELAKTLPLPLEKGVQLTIKELGTQLDEEFSLIDDGKYAPNGAAVPLLGADWVNVGGRRFLAFPEPRGPSAHAALWEAVLGEKITTVVKLVRTYKPMIYTGPAITEPAALAPPIVYTGADEAAGGSQPVSTAAVTATAAITATAAATATTPAAQPAEADFWEEWKLKYPDLQWYWDQTYGPAATGTAAGTTAATTVVTPVVDLNPDYFPLPDQPLELKSIGLTVICETSVELRPDLTRRTFVIQKGAETHRVTHLDFEAWPDMGVPQIADLAYLLNVLYNQCDPGPTGVHCAMGKGRTGTFLAAAGVPLLQQRFEIPELIARIRKERSGLVESDTQYRFLHRLLHMVQRGVDLPDLDKPVYTPTYGGDYAAAYDFAEAGAGTSTYSNVGGGGGKYNVHSGYC